MYHKQYYAWTRVTVYDPRQLRRAATRKALQDYNMSRHEWADWRKRSGTVEACLAILFDGCQVQFGTNGDPVSCGYEIEDSGVS